jgi:hypothetical protein
MYYLAGRIEDSMWYSIKPMFTMDGMIDLVDFRHSASLILYNTV